MAQRRGHHQPPEHEWYLHRLQPGYSPYHPTNDERLYTQNNTEFCRDLDIGDHNHDRFYHEGTVSERYYKDDYRDYSSTGHNQFQPEPVEYTGHDRYQPHSDIRYQPHPNEYAGRKRYQPDPVEYTGQDRYQPHPDEYSSDIRYQPDPVEYTGQDRYQPHPNEYSRYIRCQPHHNEYTGHDRYQPHPDRYASDIRYQPDPNEYTGQKSYQPDPNEYTGHKQYQPYFDEYTALNHDQFTSYKKHQPNSDEYIDHNRSQFQSVKDTGLNRFERVQSGPTSYASTSNNRQIPSLTGRGSYRSPSKKWNSPKRSSGSANKIVHNTISKPGSIQVTTPPQTSPGLLVEVKRNHESAPAETAMRELPKFDKPGQIDSMKSQTINFENQTSYKEPKVDLPLNSSLQVIDSEDELSKQSDKKSSEIPVPGSPAAKLCQKQILPRKEVDIDNQENSITENLTEDKLIEEIKEENSDTATCNVKELSNESQNFSEVELVNKLKSVHLGTSIKGKDSRQEKLANAQSTAKTADVNDKAKSSAVAGVEKVDKTEKSDNVMDISCSRKDSVTNEQEPEKLEDEMHVKLNFASQEVVHKEIDDKNKEDEKNNSLKQADDNFNEHVNPSNENVDETSKSCGKIEQDNDVEDTSHRNKSVLHSLNVSEPDYSKIRGDLTKYAKDSDIKELQTNEDLNGKSIDQGGEVLSDDWKSKKINDFHKRVLGKLSVKTSLVQKINNRSLEILKKEKDLNTSGSSLELCSHEESMEIDESLDLITDTDTSVDLESNIDHEFININDPNVDSRSKNEKYKVHINQPKEGEIEACLDSSSKENSMDMFKTLTNTEQEVVVDRDEEMISEYLGCEGFNQVKGSEIDLVNDMSDVSMHFIDNVELNLKKVYNNGNVFELNTGGTNNTDNAKFENSGNAVVVFAGDLGGLNTNNSLAVVDVVTDYFNNSENANELQNINTLETGDAKHMNNKDIVKIIDGNIIESKDNGSNVGTEIVDISAYDDETFGESENRIVDFDVTMKTGDHDVVYDKGNLAVEVGSDTVANCSGKDVLQDLKLKQKYKIRESFIPLDKVDCHGYKGNPSVKQSSKYIETETEDTEGNTEETTSIGNTEDISINKSYNDQQHNKPMDIQSVETDSLTATDMHSLTDLNKGDTQEKSSESSNGGLKKVIPLSERFGQLTNRPEETDHDSEETEFKAEYENIVNRLKTSDQKSGPHEQTTSNTEQYKEMEVDEPTGENEVKVSEMANEVNDKVIKYNDRKEVAEQSNKENLRQSMSNGDANNDNGMSEVKKDVKPMGTSPVSFLDYSDESDDELLVTPSAFLRSIEEINGRPLVITPTKVIDSSQNSNTTSSSSDLSPLKPVAQRPGLKNKFTLDGLLADHEERADHVKEMNEIDKELQNEIKQGGFVNILNKEDAEVADSPITDEQKEILRQFEVEESRICEDRPGIVVFERENYQCLFTSNLRPTDCGYTVESKGSTLEKHLESLTPAQYKRVISSGIISQCFTKITHQTPVMRWLFLLMSVNEDHQVQQGCKKMLLEILHYQLMDGQQKWAPRLVDILSVLHNYGAALESLIPCNSSTLEIIRGKLVKEPGHIHQPGVGNIGMKTENLILVLQILAQCLNGPSGRYSPNDLSLLCVALCKASLDTSIKHFCAKGAFQNCITMVIRQYLDADWLKERLKLTRMLVGITDHHHNNAHIAELLPPGARGMFIQRGFCYLVLSEILLDRTNVSDELLNSIKIKDMEKFIPKLKDVLEIDSYKLSSVVTLIDKCVGVNMTLNSEERGQLKCLLEKVRCVRVRDNVSMLDRTRVKDMIVRMTSKWALDIQTMKGKQTKIFEYASPVKMHVEQVQATQSSDEEDEQSDSDDDLPCKIQKISPQINT